MKRRPDAARRAWPWAAAVALHALALAALQFGAEPARSKLPEPETARAVRAQLLDAGELRARRAAHEAALRELERQREAERRRQAERRQAAARKQAEARQRQAAEKKKAAERKKAVEKKKAAERQRRAAEQKQAEARAAAERRKLEAARAAAEERRRAERGRARAAAALRARQLAAWRGAIQARVEQFWRRPEAARRAACEVAVEQDADGRVRAVEVRDCPASPVWRESLRDAVRRASPLPRAPDAALFEPRLLITFRPREDAR